MKPRHHPSGDETRDRIIAAAGSVFGERGFRGTTVRQITSRAGVNVAAVNYHFRDKAELYLRVLREAKQCAARISLEDLRGTAEERLAEFVDRFVRHLLDPQRPAWQGRVLALEMSNPTPALDIMVRETMAPFFDGIRALVDEVAGGGVPAADLDLLTGSVIGQCVFYSHSRPVVEQLARGLAATPNRTDRIAAHIASFSLSALRAFREQRAAVSA